jgi:hypothetical protein
MAKAPGHVVQRAIDRAQTQRRAAKRDPTATGPFDRVWCVFDREAANQSAGFAPAVSLANQHKIELAISNPSFEYWYLLHFYETNRPFQDADEVRRELDRPTRIPAYHKALNVFDLLRGRTDEALDRAERLYENHPDRATDPYPNPSTLVYRLVGGIVAMTTYR